MIIEIKKILKKYKLIVILVLVVLILIFVRVYFSGNTNQGNQLFINKTNKITPTAIPTIKESGLSPEKLKRFDEIKTDEEMTNFLGTLTLDEILSLPDETPTTEVDDLLPYQGDTFVAEKYVGKNVLLVKSKITDTKKAEVDVKKWLNNYQESSEQTVIVWH